LSVLGTLRAPARSTFELSQLAGLPAKRKAMDSIIYLIGLIVVVMFILSLLGLH
jgi:hypothetical protein